MKIILQTIVHTIGTINIINSLLLGLHSTTCSIHTVKSDKILFESITVTDNIFLSLTIERIQ